ncbi:MAG: HD domain-containing protein [Thermoprotei archaeon]
MSKFHDFVEFIGVLKNIPRIGWIQRGVPLQLCETVAEHIFEVSSLVLMFSQRVIYSGVQVDLSKALSMSIIHDWAEAITGDIPKSLGKYFPMSMKENIEMMILSDMFKDEMDIIKKFFAEYLERKSIEAQLVKLADHVSTVLQGRRYLSSGYNVNDIVNNSTSEALKLVEKGELSVLKHLIEELLSDSR